MPKAIPFGGHESKRHYARARHGQGASIKQIAGEMGCSYQQVYNAVHPPARSIAAGRRESVLRRQAAQRGVTIHALKTRLLQIIVDDDLFAAVLDDQSPEGRS